MTRNRWQPLPTIVVPSPVFTLAAGQDGIWAGGTGGVAWYSTHPQENALAIDGWQSRISTLTLSLVTALAYREGLLLAGGLEGIAGSRDGGLHWQQAILEDGAVSITAFALSPQFAKDHTAIAGTMENGILRTDDGGHTWVNASFGLESFEVTALAWFSGSALLAATSDGIYRSSNGGRAWRRVYEGEDLDIEAIVPLADRELLASLESGELLRSVDGGAHWSLDEHSLQDVHILSLFVEAVGGKDETVPRRANGKVLFVGTQERGLLRSLDGGINWETVYSDTVFSLVPWDDRFYAGTNSGVICSDDNGHTWYDLPCPPVHDLCDLLVYEKQPLLKGAYAGVMHYTGTDWKAFPDLPQGLTGIAIAPDGSLFVSSTDGLMRLAPGETPGRAQAGSYERRMVIEGQDGQVSFMAFLSGGSSWQMWVASGDGTRLLRSDDEGVTWQPLRPPFGVLPVVALEAMPQRLIAATYDPRQYRICVWSSTDDGETWERGMEAETQWPLVAMCADPPLVTISSVILLQNALGQWNKVSMSSEGGMVRRAISMQHNNDEKQETSERTQTGPYNNTLIVLTTTGIHRSDDGGESWRQDNEGLPVDQIVDIAGDDTNLYILLAGGHVWRRSL